MCSSHWKPPEGTGTGRLIERGAAGDWRLDVEVGDKKGNGRLQMTEITEARPTNKRRTYLCI